MPDKHNRGLVVDVVRVDENVASLSAQEADEPRSFPVPKHLDDCLHRVVHDYVAATLKHDSRLFRHEPRE
jgi:hypothetical protein